MIHFVYILQCADKTLYVGATNNLEKRLKQHNESKSGAHYTKIRRPVKLLYSEKFKTLASARHREAELKGWKRDKKIELIKRKKITNQSKWVLRSVDRMYRNQKLEKRQKNGFNLKCGIENKIKSSRRSNIKISIK